jgi:tRNA(fMet)-specific endonuclease VapC
LKYLLDTNVWVALLRNTSPSIALRLESAPKGELTLCTITLAELVYGAQRSQRPAENLKAVFSLVANFECLQFDRQAAEAYGGIRAGLESKGTPIGGNDLLIAAVAYSRDLTVVTGDIKEFCRVDGLAVENWA